MSETMSPDMLQPPAPPAPRPSQVASTSSVPSADSPTAVFGAGPSPQPWASDPNQVSPLMSTMFPSWALARISQRPTPSNRNAGPAPIALWIQSGQSSGAPSGIGHEP